jgi:hypothetical protein
MTTIRVDAETLAKLKKGNGPIYLCDDSGMPMIRCVIAPSPVPDHEPDLTPEEWKKRMDPTGAVTTAQMLDYLRNLEKS